MNNQVPKVTCREITANKFQKKNTYSSINATNRLNLI